MAYDRLTVLPTGHYMNPAQPESATYFNDQLTLYTMYKVSEARTRPTRVVSSYGDLGFDIGDQTSLIHDQTQQNLGRYQVVGIYDVKNGYAMGDLPNRKIKHAVCK